MPDPASPGIESGGVVQVHDQLRQVVIFDNSIVLSGF